MLRQQVQVVVYNEDDGDLCFLMLKRTPQKGGFWQCVTGGVEQGECLDIAAAREAWEETGIKGGSVSLNYRFTFTDHGYDFEEFAYLLEAPSLDVIISPEHTEYRWCSYEESCELMKYDTGRDVLAVALKAIC